MTENKNILSNIFKSTRAILVGRPVDAFTCEYCDNQNKCPDAFCDTCLDGYCKRLNCDLPNYLYEP